VNSQTRIQDHANSLTERVVRDLRRHTDSDKLTSDEIVRAERAVALQLLTGKRDLFRTVTADDSGLVDIGQVCIDSAVRGPARLRYMAAPAPERDGTWALHDTQTGQLLDGRYGSAAAAANDAADKEAAA
jgi:hypothetical protein